MLFTLRTEQTSNAKESRFRVLDLCGTAISISLERRIGMIRDAKSRLFCNQDKSKCAKRNDRDRICMSAFCYLASNSSGLLVDATPYVIASMKMRCTCLADFRWCEQLSFSSRTTIAGTSLPYWNNVDAPSKEENSTSDHLGSAPNAFSTCLYVSSSKVLFWTYLDGRSILLRQQRLLRAPLKTWQLHKCILLACPTT